MAWLPNSEKILKICLFVFTELTNVTDRQTDGHRMTAVAVLMYSIARQQPLLRRRWWSNMIGRSVCEQENSRMQ